MYRLEVWHKWPFVVTLFYNHDILCAKYMPDVRVTDKNKIVCMMRSRNANYLKALQKFVDECNDKELRMLA